MPNESARSFHFVETDEPHATRRKQILAKHPEMSDLFGPEIRTFPIVLGIIAAQFAVAAWMANNDAHWAVILVVGYVFGGTCNHSLQLASHELSHNLCFHTPFFNKLLAIACNLATAVPSSITFQRYHMDHHQYQGVDGIDTDVPTQWEVDTFDNSVKKVLWLIGQPFFYGVRPLLVKPKSPTKWELINNVLILGLDMLVYLLLGPKALIYLLTGTFLGMGLHPVAGHFVAEHYEFTRGYETYSYYGPCNWVNFNVGYHYEHHDFPKVAWSNLPRVRKIAPEFYENLPSYTSYLSVFWRYITDASVGPFSRVKRITKDKKETN